MLNSTYFDLSLIVIVDLSLTHGTYRLAQFFSYELLKQLTTTTLYFENKVLLFAISIVQKKVQ